MTEIERVIIGMNALMDEKGGTPRDWAIQALKQMKYIITRDGKHHLYRDKLARDISKDNGRTIRSHPNVGRGTFIHIIKIMIEGL
jgi:hypothetical protein